MTQGEIRVHVQVFVSRDCPPSFFVELFHVEQATHNILWFKYNHNTTKQVEHGQHHRVWVHEERPQWL
jgi:hypothetical protein